MGKFKLNEMVRFRKPWYKNLLFGTGEIIGFARSPRHRGYAVKFARSYKTYFVTEDLLESLGKIGNREIMHYGAIQTVDGTICMVYDTENLEHLKPKIELNNDILIIQLPELYEFEICLKMFMNEIPGSDYFSKIKHIVIDARKLSKIGYLGMGSELFNLYEKLKGKDNWSFSFVGLNDIMLKIVKQLYDKESKDIPNYESLQEAIDKIRDTSL